MRAIKVGTKKIKEVVDITSIIEKFLQKHPAKDGMMHLFLKHSTAGLTTAYIEEKEDLGLIGAFEIMLPKKSPGEGEGSHSHYVSHLPDHIAASMLGHHLAVPVTKNKLALGKFQSIALVELNGPRKREILLDYSE